MVEDDAASRSAMHFLLRRAGYRVESVATVADALASLRHDRPDVVILDLMLPDGDGLDVLSVFRAIAPTSRVAIVSGVSDPGWLSRVASDEHAELFRKPVDFKAMLCYLQSEQ